MSFVRHIPALLTTYRLLLGPAAIGCAFARVCSVVSAFLLGLMM